MYKLNPNELWKRVKQLEGRTVYTIAQNRPNVVKRVTEKEVIIEGRRSRIMRNEIVDAYNLLWEEKKLQLRKGWKGPPQYMWYVTLAILHAAVPEQVEVIHQEGYSGIRLKLKTGLN